ncbi:unnamed protein product [Penicillium salamii]|uniref:Uncharacterized protein n=1 Tax=Penicillium salamii TaxID=1612424 RepID=A0A9W4J685_9EURO|nr:unnamed protein product [Penicillium salamii]CAG8377052.1 unnamed protein product [Penicillium salamii]
MQLNLASAVGLLAAITPALAGTFVVPKFEEITKLVIETRDILKDFNLDNAAKTYPSAVARLTLAGSHKNSLLERFPTSFDTADQASLCETYVKVCH